MRVVEFEFSLWIFAWVKLLNQSSKSCLALGYITGCKNYNSSHHLRHVSYSQGYMTINITLVIWYIGMAISYINLLPLGKLFKYANGEL